MVEPKEGWRGRLRETSFRGVPFFTTTEGRTGGRRVTVHEFPERDIPYSEDHGRKARRFPIEAILIGPDYDLARDRLIQALEEAGSGELIMSRHGAHRVVVDSFETRSSSEIGRIARIDIEFIEAGERREPSIVAGTGDEVLAEASAAEPSLIASLAKTVKLDRVSSWIQESAIATWTEASDHLASAIDRVRSDADAVRELELGVRNWSDGIASGILNVEESATDLVGFYQSFSALDDDPMRLLGLLTECRIFSAVGDSPSSTTFSRKLEAENRDALEAIVCRATSLALARVATQIEFTTTAEAENVRDQVLEILDADIFAAAEARDDEVSEALRSLRRTIVDDFDRRIRTLPRLSTFTPRSTIPAIVLSQRFYGSGEYAAEIAERNRVDHASFVLGGVALEVVERAG